MAINVNKQEEKKNKDLATTLRTSPEIIQDYKNLANSEEFKVNAPEYTQKSLQDSIRKAEELYDKKATRNEWLEVAQTLSNALAQFGAASTAAKGQSGVIDPTKFNIDYGRRTDRALGEMQQQVRNQGQVFDAGQVDYRRALDEAKTRYERTADPLKLELGTVVKREDDERALTRDELRAKQAAELEALRQQETDKRIASAEKIAQQKEAAAYERELLRQRLQDEKENKKEESRSLKETLDQNKLEYKELDNQEKQLRKEKAEAEALINDVLAKPDLSKKNREKIQAQLGQRAGKAGVDLPTLLDTIESDELPRKDAGGIRGVFGGKDIDKKAAFTVLKSKLGISDKEQQLIDIAKRKAELSKGPGRTTRTESVKSADTVKQTENKPVNPGTVRVEYQGQIREILQSDLQEALKSGAKVVK